MSDHLSIDAIGFVAAGLVLATFSMRSMCALRWVALASNLIFIAYGYLGNLAPVLLLHALLLPVNAYRLTELRWAGSPPKRPDGTKEDATMTGKSVTIRTFVPAMVAFGPLLLTLAVFASGAAHAHPVRYLSSTGSDANNCNSGDAVPHAPAGHRPHGGRQ